MPYSLWSRDRLLGHTALDMPCAQDRFRQGFLEPTPLGRRLLVDATGVVAICGRRVDRTGAASDAYLAAFTRAVERREALNLVLCDDAGETFDCDFIRIYDLFDTSPARRDADARYGDGADDSDDIDSDLLTEIEEEWGAIDESNQYGSTWPPEPALGHDAVLHPGLRAAAGRWDRRLASVARQLRLTGISPGCHRRRRHRLFP